MSEHDSSSASQGDIPERTLLDQLLSDAKLYTRSEDFLAVLECVVRMRNFAPFNAMLLQIQKPGVMYAASARDWYERFERYPKEGARPLLILWPFAPVALVYDLADTEGQPLPEGITPFAATGSMNVVRLKAFSWRLARNNIEWQALDAGEGSAGYIRVLSRSTDAKTPTVYRMQINQHHTPVVQFATLAHELAHLYLGHLGADRALRISSRPNMGHAERELEAEAVAFLVCARNNIRSHSERYLYDFVRPDTNLDQMDLYAIMRAAGQVETLLGLAGAQ